MGFIVNGIWAYLGTDEDGDEGVLAVETPGGGLPLIAADPSRLLCLQLFVQQARESGARVRLVRFDQKIELSAEEEAELVKGWEHHVHGEHA